MCYPSPLKNVKLLCIPFLLPTLSTVSCHTLCCNIRLFCGTLSHASAKSNKFCLWLPWALCDLRSRSSWPGPHAWQCPTESSRPSTLLLQGPLPAHTQMLYGLRSLKPFGGNHYSRNELERSQPGDPLYRVLWSVSTPPNSVQTCLGLGPWRSACHKAAHWLKDLAVGAATPLTQNFPPHPPFLREDGCVQGREVGADCSWSDLAPLAPP